MKYTGGCHCGTVKFEVDAPADIEAVECNCSICEMTGFLHLIVPLSKFKLLQGADQITTYTFNSGIAKHTFCSVCGIKPFYTPRSNPDGIDINIRCLHTRPNSITMEKFDGQHWEDNAHTLAHKSQE